MVFQILNTVVSICANSQKGEAENCSFLATRDLMLLFCHLPLTCPHLLCEVASGTFIVKLVLIRFTEVHILLAKPKRAVGSMAFSIPVLFSVCKVREAPRLYLFTLHDSWLLTSSSSEPLTPCRLPTSVMKIWLQKAHLATKCWLSRYVCNNSQSECRTHGDHKHCMCLYKTDNPHYSTLSLSLFLGVEMTASILVTIQ